MSALTTLPAWLTFPAGLLIVGAALIFLWGRKLYREDQAIEREREPYRGRHIAPEPATAELPADWQHRAEHPDLYLPADVYWSRRALDLGVWLAEQNAERNTWRRENGLKPDLPPLPRELVAA